MAPKGIDIDTKMRHPKGTSKIHRRYVTPGKELNTGVSELWPVHVRDARPIQDECKLDVCGFQLFQHKSKVKDFNDLEEVEKVYLPEIEEVVKNAIGADKVIAYRPIIRKASSVKRTQDQPVGDDVHVDFTTRWAAKLGTDHLKADWRETYSRLLIVSNWRVFSKPPQDWPLGICDSRSVGNDEGIVNTLVYQEDIPDIDNLPPLSEARIIGEGTIFPRKDTHRWFYFSHMNMDEMLTFKLNDSDKSGVWRTPHCAFFNPEEGAFPRESMEVRMCCYFK